MESLVRFSLRQLVKSPVVEGDINVLGEALNDAVDF